MSVHRVSEILKEHVTLELEGIDRMYLNAYVPGLQSPEGAAWFFKFHRGQPFASSVLMDPNRGSARSVVNMSFVALYTFEPAGGCMEQSVATLVNTYNIIVVCAAGNYNSNVFWYIPANTSRGITVAGINKDSDTRWQYSNFGYVTKFYAPAQFVEAASTTPYLGLSQWRSALSDCVSNYGPDTCTSGTSFAAPIVAGVIARYLQHYPAATRDQIVSGLQSRAIVYIDDAGPQFLPLINYADCQ